MVAHTLVHAGERVLMLERGPWVTRGPENWAAEAWKELSPYYSMETPYQVDTGGRRRLAGAYHCVGGPSVLYAAVALRLREQDFEPDARIVGDSNARWPFSYADLEPYYSRAEQILGVSGADEDDPTAPRRSAPYPYPPAELAPTARLIQSAARSLDLSPFRLPLAINQHEADHRRACVGCARCDGFVCAISAKNDLATQVLPELIRRGLVLKPNTVAIRLIPQGGALAAVECVETPTGQVVTYRARRFVLSAGALASPHLLLASGLECFNPAGEVVGRNLLRHCNMVICGWFVRDPNPTPQFDKQIGVHDYYFGHPTAKQPRGKLGSLQSISLPSPASFRAYLPRWLGLLVAPFVGNLLGLLAIAEDQPRFENRVLLDPRTSDRWGRPTLVIQHHYSNRDWTAARALARKSKQILRRAGALFCYAYSVNTLTHAAGTVRMGLDPRTSPLDASCRFRGLENLYVVDGSCLPTFGAVNPSLTIAANALRVAASMTETSRQKVRLSISAS